MAGNNFEEVACIDFIMKKKTACQWYIGTSQKRGEPQKFYQYVIPLVQNIKVRTYYNEQVKLQVVF